MTPMEMTCIRNRVKYEQPMIDSDHRNSLWYGGDVLHVDHRGCTVTLRANGDVIAEYQSDPADKTLISVRDKSCHGVFYEKMRNAIPDDKELLRLSNADQSPGHAWLELVDNNWWEAFVVRDGTEITSVVLDSENYDEALTEMLESIDSLTED